MLGDVLTFAFWHCAAALARFALRRLCSPAGRALVHLHNTSLTIAMSSILCNLTYTTVLLNERNDTKCFA